MSRAAPAPGKARARHAEIQDHLRARIAKGLYPVGSLLPSEQVLQEEFSSSRFTVRQALAGLRASGLIEARPGSGTYVTRTTPRETIVHRMSSFEELLRYPSETTRKQISVATIAATPSLAHLLRGSSGGAWVHLKAMRVARHTGAAISWLDAYIAPQFADVLDLPNAEGAPLLTQIEGHHGHRAAGAEVEIFVSRIEAELAEPLQCAAGDPALIILRRYRGANGGVYLVTYSVHPENRFSLTFDLSKHISLAG